MANAGRKINHQKTWDYKRHSFGSGTTVVDDRELWGQFASAGVSLTAFRCWLRALGVPVVHAGKKRLVRLQAFQTAFIAATSIGQPDMLMPGCKLLKKNPKSLKDNPLYTRTLDPALVRAHFSEFLEELLLSRAIVGSKLTEESVKLANTLLDTYIQEAVRLAPLQQLQLERDGRRKERRKLIGKLPSELK